MDILLGTVMIFRENPAANQSLIFPGGISGPTPVASQGKKKIRGSQI